MYMDKIIIKGARENNLKNIDIEIPKNKLVVMTGVSGSGKSSLAFDTIYAEGQRRYVESLSAYARQFIAATGKPDVDTIEGLSPSISIDQKTTNKNPRSTVGTVTEIYDYLRLLFARIGVPYCPNHHIPISSQSVEEMTTRVLSLEESTKIMVMSPIVKGEKGTQKDLFEKLRKEGYIRVKVDGEVKDLSEDLELDKNKKHNISVIIDRLVVKEGIRSRLYSSLETATKLSHGKVIIDVIGGEELLMSEDYACPYCEYPQKYSVSDSPDSCDSTYQTDRGTELWLQCNDRTACNCSGSVHCPYGGIFTERSGTGSDRGSSQHGRRNTDDHLESPSCRSKNFSSCRSNDCRRNNPWVLRCGRNCWGRRTWRYGYSLWILPLSDRHYDRNDYNSGSACADPAGTWHDALQEAG